ncbi:conserved hypothetical protein [Burkholderia latens]|uniref:hypothetical protein n=1 Tax=Burkholderia latens TaxID=488446 RepID=UPI0039A503FA
MTRPIDHLNASGASNAHAPDGLRRVLRVALRLWGVDERTAQGWLPWLQSQHPRLAWQIARDRAAVGADVVVHVVKPSARRSDGFCWNSIGANGAMVRSRDGARSEVALLAGHTRQLPNRRAGHWAIAGKLDSCAALDALARALHASAVHGPDGRIAVRTDLLALIATRLDAMEAPALDED